MKNDVQKIVESLIAKLEAGVRPWHRPWKSASSLPLRHNGQPYQGLNILVLWSVASENHYSSPYWMTYKQATEMRAQVMKGQKGSRIVFAQQISKEDEEGKLTAFPIFKSYVVFNAEQIEGLPDSYYPSCEQMTEFNTIKSIEEFFSNTGAEIVNRGGRACYSPSIDRILMPARKSFESNEKYYGTLAHEMIHWTAPRVKRDLGKRFGDEAYAMEELIAEIGAALTCSHLGLPSVLLDDHASYLSCWIQMMKADPRILLTASSKASEAFNYLLSKQPQEEASAA